jgi:FixJ family two-component response regulator
MSLERDRIRRALETEMAALRGRFQSLTQREREVVALAVSGMLNKQIGARIGIAENTVKVHRSRGMRKMEARSFAHLVGMVGRISTTLPQVA